MPLAQNKAYTEADYYNLPEDVRAELIEGNLIYNQGPLKNPSDYTYGAFRNNPELSQVKGRFLPGIPGTLRCQTERGQENHS